MKFTCEQKIPSSTEDNFDFDVINAISTAGNNVTGITTDKRGGADSWNDISQMIEVLHKSDKRYNKHYFIYILLRCAEQKLFKI